MPFKDDDRRREYHREYRRNQRDKPARNRQDRDRRAAKRKAERKALPDPVRPDLWPHQRALFQVLESPDPPRLLTIRKGARVGLTTVQLMLADAAASRGEAVGVYAPTMTMARELGRLFAAEVAAPAKRWSAVRRGRRTEGLAREHGGRGVRRRRADPLEAAAGGTGIDGHVCYTTRGP